MLNLTSGFFMHALLKEIYTYFLTLLDELLTYILKTQIHYLNLLLIALMSWFIADFGRKCGALKIIFDYGITSEKAKKLDFKNYDWTLLLKNYRTIPK